MRAAAILIGALILAMPAGLLFDGAIERGCVSALAAVSVASVSVGLSPRDYDFLRSIIRPVVIAALLPVLWMMFQLFPLPGLGAAYPVWQSAAATLGRPITGTISIDPGATALSLASYLSIGAIAFVVAATALDRRLAGWLLGALTAAIALTALMVLAVEQGLVGEISGRDNWLAMRETASDCVCLGVIIAVAALHQLFAAIGDKRGRSGPVSVLLLASIGALATFALCCTVLVTNGSMARYFAVGCGGAVLVAVVIIRRYRLGPWGIASVAALAFFAFFCVLTLRPAPPRADPVLTFAYHAPVPMLDITERMLAQTNWIGFGAGTFSLVVPIYQDIDGLSAGANPPTAAAAIAVEMGWPFLLVMLLGAGILVIVLMRGALRRGRDWSYAMAGAGCVLTMAVLVFTDASLFSTAVVVTTSAVVGIGLAQSASRQIRTDQPGAL